MSTEAMQQAMEALKESIDVPCYGGHPKQEAAYRALQEALANEALDKKAENARELGLDYEPAQQEFASPGGGYVPAIPAQQPAQQEPVDFASLLREAEELVREKPTWKRFIDGTPLANDIAVWMTVFAQDVARRTSPQPAQQEPVAWMDGYRNIYSLEEKAAGCAEATIALVPMANQEKTSGSPINELQCICGAIWLGDEMVHLPDKRLPASKPWVGLTEKEEVDLWEGTDSDWELMKRTEAKLKEKNNG